MSSPEHQQAQDLAAQAGLLAQAGRGSEAVLLYQRAADWERKALQQIAPERVRTRGILAVSLAALLYKARALVEAETTICSFLAQSDLPAATRAELRELLRAVWQETEASAGHSTASPESR